MRWLTLHVGSGVSMLEPKTQKEILRLENLKGRDGIAMAEDCSLRSPSLSAGRRRCR
jgi:hypothetical protein